MQQHALLLKRNGSNFEGITVEGEAYNKFLANGTVPTGKQIIEFTFQKNAWGSMDEAIDFYENMYKNTNNAISKDIIWKNYRRDLWRLVKEGTSGNTNCYTGRISAGLGEAGINLLKMMMEPQ